MRSPALTITTGFAVALSLLWLAGYADAVRPFAASGISNGNYDFLRYPDLKIYREIDETTGALSTPQVIFYNVADAPTGTQITEAYVPGWLISIGALAVTLGGGFFLFFGERKAGG